MLLLGKVDDDISEITAFHEHLKTSLSLSL